MSYPADELSPREHEVLCLVASGKRNTDIARELRISEATVENHLHRIFVKLGVSNRTQAVMYAIQRGITDLNVMKEILQDGRR